MKIRRPTGTWLLAWVLGAAAWQAGCQQASTPPAGESAANKPAQPPGASAPSATPSQAQPAPKASGAAPSAPVPPGPRMAILAVGTPLKVRTTSTLSTKTLQARATFSTTLEEPLMQGDWVIAPKGSELEGRVLESDPGGRVKGVARLSIALDLLHTADGQAVEISTNGFTVEAKSTEGKDAAKIAIGTGVGAAIGAIAGGKKGAGIGAATGAGAGTAAVLATRGDPAEISSETVLNFVLNNPVHIMEKK